MFTRNAKSIIQFIIFCFIAVNVCRVKGIKTEPKPEFDKSTEFEVNDTENDSGANHSSEEYYDDPAQNTYKPVDDSKGNLLISKLFDIHNKNKDTLVVKNVKNINKTFEIIDRLSNIAVNLSKDILTNNDLSKIVELFFSLDVAMDCLLSLVEVVSAVRKEELWAVKCKH